MIKGETLKKDKTNKLINALKNDENLDGTKKVEFLSMANLFLIDFKDNISLTSIEMDEKHKLGMDSWQEFLNYPVVRKYIKGFKDEHIKNSMDIGLMNGDRDAVAMKKAMGDSAFGINNSHIILIRVPEKVDFNES